MKMEARFIILAADTKALPKQRIVKIINDKK